MNNIRKLIRETLEEVVLSEAAVAISDVLANPNIGLVITKLSNGVALDLYDFLKHRVLATTDCVHLADNVFQQTGVAAEKGYGPMIYEMAMMTIYDNGLTLTRSGDIRGTAFEVWEKFYHRNDVVKFSIPEGSRSYSEEYPESEYGDRAIIGNTAFTMPPSGAYENIIERTPILMRIHKISKEEIREQGGNFFAYKYADS
jgi:hypothetical protein